MLKDKGATKTLGQDLASYLAARDGGPSKEVAKEVTAAILALAGAAAEISALAMRGPLAGDLGGETGGANSDGDQQKHLDVLSNEVVMRALAATSTAYYASEEEEAILTLNPNGALAVAADPLDGSSNIAVNLSIGTIFSIFPASPLGATASFFRPGDEQLAAGYFIYGPHTALVLTTGDGTDLFAMDPASKTFFLAQRRIAIPVEANEFAINISNYRHWQDPIRLFVDDCIAGADGPLARNFNMRWVASMVADAHRIFGRGGIYLYPEDRRPGYAHGRLRLIYEAFPVAMLVEQAGGAATCGHGRLLDKIPAELHERTGLIFGSARNVALVDDYFADTGGARDHPPLFGQRGLFRS